MSSDLTVLDSRIENTRRLLWLEQAHEVPPEVSNELSLDDDSILLGHDLKHGILTCWRPRRTASQAGVKQ
jgi:hypothetical protein